MGRLITRRIITALLSISFALGVAMSNAQAASMMVQMAMAAEMGSDMGMSGNHDCGGCGGTEKSDMKSMAACDQNCVAPLAAILPATFAVADAQPVRHVPAPAAPEFDRAPRPDPSPPKS